MILRLNRISSCFGEMLSRDATMSHNDSRANVSGVVASHTAHNGWLYTRSLRLSDVIIKQGGEMV